MRRVCTVKSRYMDGYPMSSPPCHRRYPTVSNLPVHINQTFHIRGLGRHFLARSQTRFAPFFVRKSFLRRKASGKVDNKPTPLHKVPGTEFMQGTPFHVRRESRLFAPIKTPAHPQDNRHFGSTATITLVGGRLYVSGPSASLGDFPRQTFSRVKLFKCVETIGE